MADFELDVEKSSAQSAIIQLNLIRLMTGFFKNIFNTRMALKADVMIIIFLKTGKSDWSCLEIFLNFPQKIFPLNQKRQVEKVVEKVKS